MNLVERQTETKKTATTTAAGFAGEIKAPRTIDAALESGEIVIIPDNYEVYTIPMGNGKTWECIVVEVLSPDGSKRAINWSPSSLVKTILTVEKTNSGNRYGKAVQPNGSVADELKAHYGESLNVAMDIIKSHGNKFKVSEYVTVETARFNQNLGKGDLNDLTQTRVYKYDWV